MIQIHIQCYQMEELKFAHIFSSNCPKSTYDSFYLNSDIFQNNPKRRGTFGLLL